MSFSDYKSYKLKDLSTKIGSGATPRGGKETYLDEGPFSLVRSQNVLDFFFSYDGLAFIDDNQAVQLSNVALNKGDVLLNITGDSVARVCQVPDKVLPARVNQHVAIIRPDRSKLIPEYLKYFLLNPSFKNFMLGIASVGATRNALTKGMIENFDIPIPPIRTQEHISNILSSLDEKIELNRQTNATLEAVAQAIFKEWFVDFNFPGATGEMQESELGLIPKGWRVGRLGEIVDVKGGTTPSTKDEKYWNGHFHWATPKDLSNLSSPVLLATERKLTKEGVAQISSGILPVGTLLLSSRAPIGYMAFSNIPVSINQGFIAINARLISNMFIFRWLKENMETVISRANGSTFLEISKSNFKEIKLGVPDTDIVDKFDQVAISLFEKIKINQQEIENLIRIRDSLLPRLMSGEIEV